jgi:hypothetical protein
LKVLWKEDHHQKGHPKYQVGLELNPEEVPLDILAAMKTPDQMDIGAQILVERQR